MRSWPELPGRRDDPFRTQVLDRLMSSCLVGGEHVVKRVVRADDHDDVLDRRAGREMRGEILRSCAGIRQAARRSQEPCARVLRRHAGEVRVGAAGERRPECTVQFRGRSGSSRDRTESDHHKAPMTQTAVAPRRAFWLRRRICGFLLWRSTRKRHHHGSAISPARTASRAR